MHIDSKSDHNDNSKPQRDSMNDVPDEILRRHLLFRAMYTLGYRIAGVPPVVYRGKRHQGRWAVLVCQITSLSL